jgi:hypothetical protein
MLASICVFWIRFWSAVSEFVFLEGPMQKRKVMIVFVVLVQVALPSATRPIQAQAAKAEYASMAPLDAYLMADTNSEVALARSAAPASIADNATVMVLGRNGYTTAVEGTNGFLCFVERSWAQTTDAPEYWNPKMRAPNCYNEAAARSIVQIYLMKTKLVLEGKSKAEIVAAISAGLGSKELPPLEPGAMCYMMSKQQYINDGVKNWHPHVMVFAAGDVGKSWGADLPGSPVMAGYDPEERMTIFMVWAAKWSDGTAGPSMMQ